MFHHLLSVQRPDSIGKTDEVSILRITWKQLYFKLYFQAICLRILGPTILDLTESLNAKSWEVARIFVARAIGYFFGALAGD
jgi:hypothetical protein